MRNTSIKRYELLWEVKKENKLQKVLQHIWKFELMYMELHSNYEILNLRPRYSEVLKLKMAEKLLCNTISACIKHWKCIKLRKKKKGFNGLGQEQIT